MRRISSIIQTIKYICVFYYGIFYLMFYLVERGEKWARKSLCGKYWLCFYSQFFALPTAPAYWAERSVTPLRALTGASHSARSSRSLRCYCSSIKRLEVVVYRKRYSCMYQSCNGSTSYTYDSRYPYGCVDRSRCSTCYDLLRTCYS